MRYSFILGLMEFTPSLIWFLFGFILLIAEFGLPGVLLVFFGVGAWITALTTWSEITPSFTSQNIVFLTSSLLLLFFLRKRMKSIFVGTTTNGGIDDEYTGKEVIALTDISTDNGKVEVKGAEWSARSESPIMAKSLVIIERRDGLTFHVRAR